MRKFLIFVLMLLGAVMAAQPRVTYLGCLQGESHRQRGFSYQGMDMWNGYALSCQNQGVATLYRVGDGSFKVVSQWHLASFHKYNHANVVSFGVEKAEKGDEFPVAYISQCHRKTVDGRKDLCYVERIAPDRKSSTLVQTIFYDDTAGDFGYAVQWVVDRAHKILYGFGNTINNDDPANCHRVIKFRLPSLADGAEVVLHREDALEDYTIEEVSGFRFSCIGQGLCIKGNELFMPTGLGTEKHPSILYIWNLKTKKMRVVELIKETTGELEDIALQRPGWFVIQGQDGLFRAKASSLR